MIKRTSRKTQKDTYVQRFGSSRDGAEVNNSLSPPPLCVNNKNILYATVPFIGNYAYTERIHSKEMHEKNKNFQPIFQLKNNKNKCLMDKWMDGWIGWSELKHKRKKIFKKGGTPFSTFWSQYLTSLQCLVLSVTLPPWNTLLFSMPPHCLGFPLLLRQVILSLLGGSSSSAVCPSGSDPSAYSSFTTTSPRWSNSFPRPQLPSTR